MTYECEYDLDDIKSLLISASGRALWSAQSDVIARPYFKLIRDSFRICRPCPQPKHLAQKLNMCRSKYNYRWLHHLYFLIMCKSCFREMKILSYSLYLLIRISCLWYRFVPYTEIVLLGIMTSFWTSFHLGWLDCYVMCWMMTLMWWVGCCTCTYCLVQLYTRLICLCLGESHRKCKFAEKFQ